MRVLIAEDDPDARLLLRRSLEELGHEVVEARDGAEAWKALELGGPRVVVSDWMLPKLDGLELCRRIRSRMPTPYVYFILCSGQRVFGEDHEKAMQDGVDDFLIKPLDVEALRLRLHVARRIVTLTERVQALEGILPMCSYCRRIRDERGRYQQLEDYVSDRMTTQFSHGVCPDCAKKLE